MANNALDQARLKLRELLIGANESFAGVNTGQVDKDLHVGTSRNLTHALGNVLPPNMSAVGADMLGTLNESAAGLTSLAAGKPWMGKTGYDLNDVAYNREGQNQALEEGAGTGVGYNAIGLLEMLAKRLRASD